MFCDLHIHSNASDGTNAPEVLAILAKRAGLGGFALTDHDTTAGLAACAKAAKKQRIDFLPGIELSADPNSPKLEISNRKSEMPLGALHILGYCIRPDDEKLAAVQAWLQEARAGRNPQMVEKLNELGVAIDYEQVLAEAGQGIVGRPHIAAVLLKKGYAKSIHEAFSRYIGQGAPGYVPKDRLSVQQAIEAIHHAGGLAVLAHPVQWRLGSHQQLEHAVSRMKTMGLDGIETRHSDHTAADVDRFEKLAAKLDLLTTGGSDYHGTRKSITIGCANVPMDVFNHLRYAAINGFGSDNRSV